MTFQVETLVSLCRYPSGSWTWVAADPFHVSDFIWDSPERAIEDVATEIYGNFCKMGEGYEALTRLTSTPLPSPI